MKLLRAIAITCFASFFAIIAYGQGEVVDLDKMELLAENCESDGEGACKDVLIDLMDQVAAAQDSNLMEPMECPEVEQEDQSDGGADCNMQILEHDDLQASAPVLCKAMRRVVEDEFYAIRADELNEIEKFLGINLRELIEDNCI
mgnify:CR=1 FL=1